MRKTAAQCRLRGACVVALALLLLLWVGGPSFVTSATPMTLTRRASSCGSLPGPFGRVASRQAQVTPRVVRRAGTVLGGFIDITTVLGETTIILQCLAAVSLVVFGNILISREEAEKKEEEEEAAKVEQERLKKRGEMLANLEAGRITAEECEVGLFGAQKMVEEVEFDIWRDSLLRYLGYSNELGEALRPVFPAAYFASYCAAFAYVLADSVDKGGRADKQKRRSLAKSTFMLLDTGCEGYLTKTDVRIAFKKMKTTLSEADMEEYFGKVDVEDNQLIDISTFMALYDKEDEGMVSLVEGLQKPSEDSGPLGNPSLVAGGDALIWQTIASVALPGFTINRFVTLAEIGCQAQAKAEGGNIVAEYFPTVLGLALIPIVCKPLDELADWGLDATLRPFLFSTLDADKSGKVTYEELAGKLKARDGELNERALRQLFDDMDTDKNGCITVDDWTRGGFKKYKAFIERK